MNEIPDHLETRIRLLRRKRSRRRALWVLALSCAGMAGLLVLSLIVR